MTADDVVFSYDHAQKDAHMGSYCRPLDHVEKIDDYTVKIVMNQPFSPIGHMLHKVKIMSKKGIEELGNDFGKVPNKVGTGPYMWDENNYNPCLLGPLSLLKTIIAARRRSRRSPECDRG